MHCTWIYVYFSFFLFFSGIWNYCPTITPPFFSKIHKKILIFFKKKFLPKSYLGLLKLQVPLKFGSFFHRPNLPHFVQNYPMDPINPFISVNHVPMEVDTDVSKNVWKINVFKMCFRTQIIQKITSQKNKKKFPFKVKNLELSHFFTEKFSCLSDSIMS